MSDLTDLVDRYIAVWNEPDPERRRRGIAGLWTEDGVHFTPSLEARGYEALEARVAGAHDKWVKAGGFVFKPLSDVDGHHDAVRFSWQMVPAGGGEAAAVGFDFLILGDGGRIRFDYQFSEMRDRPSAPSPPIAR
jgi:hypothetical protein